MKATLENQVDGLQRTAKMPSRLNVSIRATLNGIVVRISGGPNDRDPLCQHGRTMVYPNLLAALQDLPHMIVIDLGDAAFDPTDLHYTFAEGKSR